MIYSEFQVGQCFRANGKRWLCTDKGTRTVIAVCLTICRANDWARGLPAGVYERAVERSDYAVSPDELEGPPYAIKEHVLDERDQKECTHD